MGFCFHSLKQTKRYLSLFTSQANNNVGAGGKTEEMLVLRLKFKSFKKIKTGSE